MKWSNKQAKLRRTEDDEEPEDEYRIEIDGFEEFELPVFLQELEDEGMSGEAVWAALHFINQYGYQGVRNVWSGFKGRTPVEIAHHFYNSSYKPKEIAGRLLKNYGATEDGNRIWFIPNDYKLGVKQDEENDNVD